MKQLRSYFIHEDIFIGGRVELSDICRVDADQFFNRLLKLGSLFRLDCLHFSQPFISRKVFLTVLVFYHDLCDLLYQVNLNFRRWVFDDLFEGVQLCTHYHDVLYGLLCLLFQLLCTVVVNVHCQKVGQDLLTGEGIRMFVRVTTDLTQGPCCGSFYQVIRNLNQWLLKDLDAPSIDYGSCRLLIVSSHVTQSHNTWQPIYILIFIKVLNHRSNASTFHKNLWQFRRLFCHLSDDCSCHFPDPFVHVFKLVKNFRE